MFRPFTLLLILCLISGSVEAATHATALHLAPAGVTSEMTDSSGVPESPLPDGGKTYHFCHCTAHSPAFTQTVRGIVPFSQRTVYLSPAQLLGASNLPPPVRPPNAR